jgi:hypothetical protein
MDEAVHSRQLLEQHLGRPVRSFAYPFGMRLDESPATAGMLSGAGLQHGVHRPSMAR